MHVDWAQFYRKCHCVACQYEGHLIDGQGYLPNSPKEERLNYKKITQQVQVCGGPSEKQIERMMAEMEGKKKND